MPNASTRIDSGLDSTRDPSALMQPLLGTNRYWVPTGLTQRTVPTKPCLTVRLLACPGACTHPRLTLVASCRSHLVLRGRSTRSVPPPNIESEQTFANPRPYANPVSRNCPSMDFSASGDHQTLEPSSLSARIFIPFYLPSFLPLKLQSLLLSQKQTGARARDEPALLLQVLLPATGFQTET